MIDHPDVYSSCILRQAFVNEKGGGVAIIRRFLQHIVINAGKSRYFYALMYLPDLGLLAFERCQPPKHLLSLCNHARLQPV